MVKIDMGRNKDMRHKCMMCGDYGEHEGIKNGDDKMEYYCEYCVGWLLICEDCNRVFESKDYGKWYGEDRVFVCESCCEISREEKMVNWSDMR